MDATGSITRLNGVSAYTAQLSLGKSLPFGKSEIAYQQAGTASADSDVGNASEKNCKEKSFGFKLGKLGIRYVTQEPGVDYSVLAEEALKHAERMQANAYRSAMECALLFNEVHTEQTETAKEQSNAISPLQAHYGVRAYSRTAQNDTAATDKGVLLGII